jgi:hypothetical protein
MPECQKAREGEFRKNVNLKVKLTNETVIINLVKLDEYSDVVDSFIKDVKLILGS